MRMILSQRHTKNTCILVTLQVLCGMLAGCIGGGAPAFSYLSQDQNNTVCAGLFATQNIQSLNGKMPILPGQMPDRDMLMINDVPSEQEKRGITGLQNAIHNCKILRIAAGQASSASEDILEARLSKLRNGLFNGEIPYAVYNYGLVQALKKTNPF